MLKRVSHLFDKDFWPEIVHYVARVRSVPVDAAWELLVDASQAYSKYVNLCAGDSTSVQRSIKDCMEESGWAAIPSEGQIGYLAMLGQVLTGQLYNAVRDVTPMAGPHSELVQYYLDTAQSSDVSRRVTNRLKLSDDLKTDLRHILIRLRDEDVSWDVINRVVTQQVNLEE